MGGRLSPSAIESLHAVAQRHVGDELVPGMVVLVAHGDDVHVETLGTLSIGGPPMARDSLFRIASTTKPLTAALTLALAGDGLIGLDEPVEKLLPELANRRVLMRMDGPLDRTVAAWRAITARDLLTFTFGFGMSARMFAARTPWPIVAADAELALNTIGPPDPEVKPDNDTWIARLGSLPLIAQPGERWLYNTGASVLGVLVSRAAGKPFAEVLRARLLEPLGMRDTAFWTAQTKRLASQYRPTPAGLVLLDGPDGAWSRPPRFEDGAAGLLSTADDLLAFARMLQAGGDGLLARELVDEMTSDQLNDQQKSHGGLEPGFFKACSWGFCQAVYPAGSFGWDGGFGTRWRVDPNRDLVTIVMTQRMWESSSPPAVIREIQAAAEAAVPARG